MDGRSTRIEARARAPGALVLLILLWPLAGGANIPRIPFQELPREALPDLPSAERWHARLEGDTEATKIELARVPPGTERVPVHPARLGD